jgi:dipeptidyl aminopeptidase/acylaminoacyl peptidase
VRLNYRDDGLQSPDRIANRIRIPVFLSAGHEDEIAPVEHTEMMEAALRKAGVPVETLYFRNEGHGVYDPENKRRFYGQLLDFLHRHIGGRAPVVATPEKK